jgi:hypothetical protein
MFLDNQKYKATVNQATLTVNNYKKLNVYNLNVCNFFSIFIYLWAVAVTFQLSAEKYIFLEPIKMSSLITLKLHVKLSSN